MRLHWHLHLVNQSSDIWANASPTVGTGGTAVYPMSRSGTANYTHSWVWIAAFREVESTDAGGSRPLDTVFAACLGVAA